MANETPEYLQEQTEEKIHQRILDAISNDLDKSEGGFIWDTTAPDAIEFERTAFLAQETLRRGFASTAASTVPGEITEELRMRASEHGVDYKLASPSKGTVTLSGTPGKQIYAGFKIGTITVGNTASIQFATDVVATIGAGGTVDVAATAVNAGKAGNVAAETITMLMNKFDGITGVTNAAAFSGGADEEDDISLLARYYTKVRLPSTGGNKADYINWSMKISGVGDVSVVPLRDGPGTVSAAIIDTDKKPAGSSLINQVQSYLNEKAPIGAIVTVEAASQVTISVSATLTIATGYDPITVKSAVSDSIATYLKNLAFAVDNDVRYVRVGEAILDTEGILDYNNLQINGGTSNITVGEQVVAVLGTVTLT